MDMCQQCEGTLEWAELYVDEDEFRGEKSAICGCSNCGISIIDLSKEGCINDWNDLQELIRKGKMYDELKALVEATERTTKTRSL